MELGLLPTLGGGIAELQRTGQASRLIDGYLRAYARAFGSVWYASYLPEALRDYTDDPELCATVHVLAPRAVRPRLWRALSMTQSHRVELSRCAVFRVFQITGVIPALFARARWGIPFVTSYGFWYARLSRPGPARIAKRLLDRLALARAGAVLAPTRQPAAQPPAA